MMGKIVIQNKLNPRIIFWSALKAKYIYKLCCVFLILNVNMNKFFSYFITSLVLLVSALFVNSCQKEYSFEGCVAGGSAPGTAVFTLAGTGSSCTGSVVSGKYSTGNPLGTGNTVQLNVDVITPGIYCLNTNSANGMVFSAYGNFTTAGSQTITLTGGGTPVATGNYTFTPPVGAGCSFIVKVDTTSAPMGSFTLAGDPNSCVNAKIIGDYTAGVALVSSNTVFINVNVTETGPYTINTDTLDGISFSAKGNFTSLGNQTITLIGSGTPDLPRNLAFTPSGNTSHCTFQLTVQNPPPSATYVLESGFGNPNPCIYTVAGTYSSNVALSASNTVSIHVFVTVLGNFTIATNTINGMIFSYTGSFTTLGAQYVALSGSGTPVSPGTYSFAPQIVGPAPLGGTTCAFDIDVQ